MVTKRNSRFALTTWIFLSCSAAPPFHSDSSLNRQGNAGDHARSDCAFLFAWQAVSCAEDREPRPRTAEPCLREAEYGRLPGMLLMLGADIHPHQEEPPTPIPPATRNDGRLRSSCCLGCWLCRSSHGSWFKRRMAKQPGGPRGEERRKKGCGLLKKPENQGPGLDMSWICLDSVRRRDWSSTQDTKTFIPICADIFLFSPGGPDRPTNTLVAC